MRFKHRQSDPLKAKFLQPGSTLTASVVPQTHQSENQHIPDDPDSDIYISDDEDPASENSGSGFCPLTFKDLREMFGQFLNRLGTEFNCSQKAVHGIVAEMTKIWSLGLALSQKKEPGKI